MTEIDPKKDPLYLLAQAVEQGDPKVAQKVKDRLDKSDNPSEMRYLEGLLILLGEKPGELEDPPTSKMIQMNIGKKMITLRSKSKQ